MANNQESVFPIVVEVVGKGFVKQLHRMAIIVVNIISL